MFTALHRNLDGVASHASTLIERINLSDNVLKGARGDLVALRSSRYTLLTCLLLVQQYLLTGTAVLACWYKRTDTDAALRCSHRFQTVWENQTGSQFTCFTSTKVQILTLNICTALRKAVAAATHELDLSADHQVRSLLDFTSTKVQVLTLKRLPLRPRRTNSTSLRTTRNTCCRLYLLY